MTDARGPWDPPPSAEPPALVGEVSSAPRSRAPGRTGRLLIMLGVLLLVGLGAFGLSGLFPGRVSSSMDWTFLLRSGGMLAIVAASLASRQLKLKEVVRNSLIWAAIVSVLLVGFSFRDQLADGWTQIRSRLIPGYAISVAPHEMVLSQDADGSYYAVGRVNGQSVTFLIDTGASDIVLSPADAERLGVNLASLRFDNAYETANGIGRGARFTADRLDVGAIALSDVTMSINQQPMKTSLLGMTFFKRLQSFAFQGSELHLKWRGHP